MSGAGRDLRVRGEIELERRKWHMRVPLDMLDYDYEGISLD
jgi:hypothetical protein